MSLNFVFIMDTHEGYIELVQQFIKIFEMDPESSILR